MPDRRRKPDRPTPCRDKTCATCGRAFAWRADLARDWDIRKFCSDACSGRPAGELDAELEDAILSLLDERGPAKTICPSEAARLVAEAHPRTADATAHSQRKLPQRAWQSLMEPARAAARRLVAEGRIVITQHGEPVDPASARGPIRLKLR
jgi:hypothetical protein